MEELKALNLVALAIAIAIALAGMFSHYVKKWLRGETHDTLFAYLFGNGTWKHTIQAMTAVFATVASMFAAGQLDLNTIQGLIIVFTIGYAGDSAFNKDSKLVLSPIK